MKLDAVWACFVLMALVLAVAATPLLRFVDADDDAAQRAPPIDGLRGFLALGVFVYHLIVTHRFVTTGIWAPPDSRFYAALGPVGVSVFFMLTGFLFWGKLLRAQGRPLWRELYIGRLMRIGPAYLLVVASMLVIVFARSGFELQEPGAAVTAQVLQWLALGIVDTQPDVNGQAARHVLAGVTWTLWYEWLFYASLVMLAPLARLRRHRALVLAGLALCLAGKMLWHLDAFGFAALFAIGMAVASLRHGAPALRWPDRGLSVVALAALITAFATAGSGYGSGTALLLGIFLYCVCSGATLFGVLVTTAARRLGHVSYSLYLMQGLVLTVVFASAPLAGFAMSAPMAFWVVGTGCALALLLAASLGYALVERPGMALGRRLIRLTRPDAAQPGRAAARSPPNDGVGQPFIAP